MEYRVFNKIKPASSMSLKGISFQLVEKRQWIFLAGFYDIASIIRQSGKYND